MKTKPAPVSFHTTHAGGINIFYRAASDPGWPVVLLLHGFPSSSHMSRNLIPELAAEYRVIAPDLPDFGFSDAPDHKDFAYTSGRRRDHGRSQVAMIAGLPYTALRDAIFTHPTLPVGLIPLFSAVPAK